MRITPSHRLEWWHKGRAFGYHACCCFWFMIMPYEYAKRYGSKYAIDGYVPCPLHR